MGDFERVKQTISGRNIMVTSWFDTQKQAWRASAPDYISLLHGDIPRMATASTREQAVGILAAHLSTVLDSRGA